MWEGGIGNSDHGSHIGFAAIRKEAGISCGSFLRKGEVFAYGRSIQNPKDLTDIDLPYSFRVTC